MRSERYHLTSTLVGTDWVDSGTFCAANQQQATTRIEVVDSTAAVLPSDQSCATKAGLENTPRTELRQVVRQIVNSPEAFTARRDDVLASLRLALVEAAIELRLPPGLERNEFLGDLLAEVHNELQADRLRPSALPN